EYVFDDPPRPGMIALPGWAEVTAVWLTHDLDAVLTLRDDHVWSDDYIRMRMAYKPRKPMNVVVVRTWNLPEPVEVPVLEHFAGCKSWVPLDAAVALDASTAAIDTDEHATRVAHVCGVHGTAAERGAV
ncbi:MAG: DUF1802 family protein, partial [bacterium]